MVDYSLRGRVPQVKRTKNAERDHEGLVVTGSHVFLGVANLLTICMSSGFILPISFYPELVGTWLCLAGRPTLSLR